MATATFNGSVIAASSDTVIVEANHYFPLDSVVSDVLLVESDRTSVCLWKGTARYYDVVVGGETAAGAAWCYPTPRAEAAHLAGRIAFYPVVTVDA